MARKGLRRIQTGARGREPRWARGRLARRLRLEPLERRDLLATITIGGTLNVAGLSCAYGNLVPVRLAYVYATYDAGGLHMTGAGITGLAGNFRVVLDSHSDAALVNGATVHVYFAATAGGSNGRPCYTVNTDGTVATAQFADTVNVADGATTFSDTSFNKQLVANPDSYNTTRQAYAFATFSILETYYDFAWTHLHAVMNRPLVVVMQWDAYNLWGDRTRSEFASPATINMEWYDVDQAPDNLGHEFGHYVACQGGFLAGSVPENQHYAGANQRSMRPTTPNGSVPTGVATLSDTQIGWNEGWADYFAVAAKMAVNADALNIPDLAQENGAILYLGGYLTERSNPDLTFRAVPLKDDWPGGGEDNEISVMRVLWAWAHTIDWGPAYPRNNGDAQLYHECRGNGDPALTLSGLVAYALPNALGNWRGIEHAATAVGTQLAAFAVSPTALPPADPTTPTRQLAFQVPKVRFQESGFYSYAPATTLQKITLRVFGVDPASNRYVYLWKVGDTLPDDPAHPSGNPNANPNSKFTFTGVLGDLSAAQFQYSLAPSDLTAIWEADVKKCNGNGTFYFVAVGQAILQDGTTTGPYWSSAVQFTPTRFRAAAKALSATEGQALTGAELATLDGLSGQDDAGHFTATINWENGAYPSAATVTYDASAGGAVISGTQTSVYAEEGPYAVSVSIFDQGTPFAIVDARATVTDAALTVTGQSGLATVEGTPFVGNVASFTDAAPEEVCYGDYTAVINWGDNGTSLGTVWQDQNTGGYLVSGYHTYAQPGVYDVSVTVSDVGGSTASVTTAGAMTVGDGALTAWGYDLAAAPGTEFQGGPVATFINAGGPDPASDYTVTITLPDGSTPAGWVTATGVSGQYIVDAAGGWQVPDTYIGVQITDNDRGNAPPGSPVPTSTATAYTWVDNYDILTAMEVPIVATVGQTYSGPVGAFTDPDPSGSFSATITWPDLSTSPGTVTYHSGTQLYEVGASGSTYAFTEDGSFVAVAVSEVAGGQTVRIDGAVDQVTLNEPITASGRSGLAATEGAEYSGVVASFPAEPGAEWNEYFAPLKYWAATITWEPGHTSAGYIMYDTPTGDWQVTGSYIYAEPGSYNPTVQIDYGGAETTATSTITVSDAALTATPVTVAPVEGQEFSGTVATFTDADPAAVSGQYTATINWGDGNSSSGVVEPDGYGGFTVTGTNSYAEAGSYTTSVTITDSGGASATAEGQTPNVTVADVPLAVAAPIAEPVQGVQFAGAVAGLWDDNPAADASDFTAAINWGDGVGGIADTTAGTVVPDGQGGFLVNGTHTYLIAGDYPISVTVTDGNGQNAPTATAASEAFVSGAGLTLTGPNATLTGIPSGADITVPSGVTLDLGNTTATLGTVTLTGGTIQNGTVMADAYNLQSGTVSANLGGDWAVTVGSGATGTVTLSGVNTYGGGTWIAGGTLVLGSSTALPSGGDVWLSSPSPYTPPVGQGSPALDLGGYSFTVGYLELDGGSIGNGSLSADAYWLQNGTISASLTGSGGMTVDGGPGDVVVLSGQNSGYSGNIELDGGAVDFVMGGLGSGQIDFQGGTLQWAAGTNNENISRQIAPIAAGQSAILDVNGNQVPAANGIGGEGGLVVEDSMGGGVLTLTAANTYSGATDVQQGTLAIGPGGSLGDTAISVASGASFAPAASTSAGNAADGSAGATLTLPSGSALNLADGTVGSFSLNQPSGGTGLTLGGATLDFDLGAAGADELVVGAGSASASGPNTINISVASNTTRLTPGTYTLVHVAGGGLSGGSFTLASATITVGGGTYYLSLGQSDTELTLTVDAPPQVVGVYLSGSSWKPAYFNALAAAGVGDATLGYRLADGAGQLAYANILGVVNANQVTIVFSKPVNVASGSLVLEDSSSSNGGMASGITVVGPPSTNSSGTTVTWALSGPLTSNKYYLALAAAGVTDAAGTELDGDWTTGVSTYAAGSGNGIPGGNFNFEFYFLAGDVNHDGKVSGQDAALDYNYQGLPRDNATNWQYDVNGDGKINGADASACYNQPGVAVWTFPEPIIPSP